VAPGPLSGDAIARVVQKRAERVGFDPRMFAGTACAPASSRARWRRTRRLSRRHKSISRRHKRIAMLQMHTRRVDLFRDHAGAAFL
jgi:hypothetical protein